MQRLIDELVNKMSESLDGTLKNMESPESSLLQISEDLTSFIAMYSVLITQIQSIHGRLNQEQVLNYLNETKRDTLQQQSDDARSLKEQLEDLNKKINDISDKLKRDKEDLAEIANKKQEYETLIAEQDIIEQQLLDFKEVKYKVESSELIAKKQELERLQSRFSDKKRELDEINSQLAKQAIKRQQLDDEIKSKVKQKEYNDNLIQLENDINKLIKEHEINYFKNMSDNIELARFRVDLTRRVPGKEFLPSNQYDKLDDILKALDEMDKDIQKKLLEQYNETST